MVSSSRGRELLLVREAATVSVISALISERHRLYQSGARVEWGESRDTRRQLDNCFANRRILLWDRFLRREILNAFDPLAKGRNNYAEYLKPLVEIGPKPAQCSLLAAVDLLQRRQGH
jgi:hypothetical protein